MFGTPPLRREVVVSIRPSAVVLAIAFILPAFVQAPAAAQGGVRRITDAALSCDQIYEESRRLEEEISRHRAASEAAQREAAAIQEAMTGSSSGSGALPVASSLLGSIPGVGMFAGLATSAATSAQMANLKEKTEQMSAAYERLAAAQERAAHAEARNDHLVALFLDRKCKLPEAAAKPEPPVQQPATPAARATAS